MFKNFVRGISGILHFNSTDVRGPVGLMLTVYRSLPPLRCGLFGRSLVGRSCSNKTQTQTPISGVSQDSPCFNLLAARPLSALSTFVKEDTRTFGVS